MTFQEFAQSCGLIVRSIEPGKWVAVPTVDHPHKRNGRYKFMGDRGWVQNWATMLEPAVWRGACDNLQEFRSIQAKSTFDRQAHAERAAQKAGWILHQATQTTHPYLAKKGFPDEAGNVWKDKLVIPMRLRGRLVGCQLIDHQGEKRFLKGQVTKGATLTFDAGGIDIFCEGFATGLSVRAAMQAIKVRYKLHICFSAGNLELVARGVERGIVIADNDPHDAGLIAARNSGHPHWISATTGEDFNDFHQRLGLFQAAISLKHTLLPFF